MVAEKIAKQSRLLQKRSQASQAAKKKRPIFSRTVKKETQRRRANLLRPTSSTSSLPCKYCRAPCSPHPSATNSHVHTLRRHLLLQRRVFPTRISRIDAKPCPLGKEQRSRVTYRKGSNGNHDHRAIEDHERRLVIGTFRPETARKLDNTVNAPDLDGHGSDGDSYSAY